MKEETVLNVQSLVPLKKDYLWCGDFYIHKETGVRVELGAKWTEEVVLVGHESLPADFKLIWGRELFIEKFQLEHELNAPFNNLAACI